MKNEELLFMAIKVMGFRASGDAHDIAFKSGDLNEQIKHIIQINAEIKLN